MIQFFLGMGLGVLATVGAIGWFRWRRTLLEAMSAQSNVAAFEELHEELCYAIDNLAETMTGEAKSQVFETIERLERLPNGTLPGLETILERLRFALDEKNRCNPCANVVVEARRRIRNSIRESTDNRRLYNYAESSTANYSLQCDSPRLAGIT